MPIISALWRQDQMELYKFKASQGNIVSSPLKLMNKETTHWEQEGRLSGCEHSAVLPEFSSLHSHGDSH